jgi:hypothetical protein
LITLGVIKVYVRIRRVSNIVLNITFYMKLGRISNFLEGVYPSFAGRNLS